MHYDTCKAALDQIQDGRTRPLSRNERHSARVVEHRLQMLVRANPETEVELSPYMRSLLGNESDVGVREAAHAAIAARV